MPDSLLRESRRLVLATSNQGKLGEYAALLRSTGYELVPHSTGVEETGRTYAENAILKAEAALAATGFMSLGDDTGLEVDVLDGRPGLLSARVAPTQVERTAAVLAWLEPLPRPWTARFVCSIALAMPGMETRTVEGSCLGEVVPEWLGGIGFGYDPIFVVPGSGLTFGQMTPTQKHAHSHRGAAVKALLATGWLS